MTCVTFQEEKAEQISIYQSFICPYAMQKAHAVNTVFV